MAHSTQTINKKRFQLSQIAKEHTSFLFIFGQPRTNILKEKNIKNDFFLSL